MATDKVPELSGKEFDNYTKEGLVVIDFFADWCMPCVMMGPIVEDLAEKMSGKVKFGKVNVSDNQDIAQKFSVSSIPNFTILKDGKPVTQFVGALSLEDLEDKVKEYL